MTRAQNGDRQAMEALIVSHTPLIRALAGRLLCPAAAQGDLIQAGCIGLMQAVRRFSPGRDARLITYAVPWILGEMRRALRAMSAKAPTLSLEAEQDDTRTTLLEMLRGSDGIDEEKLDLSMALRQLSGEERTLICLRFFRDKTQKEAALLLRKSQTQISRMEQRALDRLRVLLA